MTGEIYTPGETIHGMFYFTTAGLLQADFTATVWKDEVEQPGIPVLINEVSSNQYSFQFDTDSTDESVWVLDIIETGKPKERVRGTWRVHDGVPADVVLQNSTSNTTPGVLAHIQQLVEQLVQLVRQPTPRA